jgi:hypothetical protein
MRCQDLFGPFQCEREEHGQDVAHIFEGREVGGPPSQAEAPRPSAPNQIEPLAPNGLYRVMANGTEQLAYWVLRKRLWVTPDGASAVNGIAEILGVAESRPSAEEVEKMAMEFCDKRYGGKWDKSDELVRLLEDWQRWMQERITRP